MTGADPLDEVAAVMADDALLDAIADGRGDDADLLIRMLLAWRDTARAGTPDVPRRPARIVRARGAAEGSDPPATPDPRPAPVCGRTATERGMPVDDRTATRKPAPTITCSGCDATWTALNAAHCSATGCHQTFSSVSLFDQHRSATGEHGACIDPADLYSHGQPCEYRDGMWRFPEMDEAAKARRGTPR